MEHNKYMEASIEEEKREVREHMERMKASMKKKEQSREYIARLRAGLKQGQEFFEQSWLK